MASTAAVTPLGLLHMRPLQHCLHSRVPRWAWRCGTLRVGITQQCRCSLSPWTDLAFLRAAVPLEQVSRHTVVTTDASSTAHPDLVSRTHFPRDSTSLAHSSEKGPPLSGARHHMVPASRSMEPPCVAPGRDAADLSGLPPAVVETIIQARAPSTRQTYALKWSLFATPEDARLE